MKKLLKKILGINYSEHNAKYTAINFIIISVMLVISAVMLLLGLLPEQMPMQWSLNGEVNYYLPSVLVAWIFPAVALLVNINYIIKGKLNITGTLLISCLCIFMTVMYIIVI